MSNIAGIFGLLLVLSGCGDLFGSPPDPPQELQTEILEIRLMPDTVAVGDTLLIHAIISDSLDSRFKYFWGLGDLIPVNGTTVGPKIRFIAPRTSDVAGEVSPVTSSVRVDNASTDSLAVTELFDIPVLN